LNYNLWADKVNFINIFLYFIKDDEPTNPSDVRNLSSLKEKDRRFFRNEESYDYQIRLTGRKSIIDYSRLVFCDQLGSGCFGSVDRGTYTDQSGVTVAVAIKTLNVESNENKIEIEKEARIMQSLDHPNIIKLIGTCNHNQSLMIVMELAKFGPLHKYLRTMKQKISMKQIILFCYQVAKAMEYLAYKNLVHRDLAARNVLLVNEKSAKISDFGMSRTMNDQNYYTSKASGKWPLKWYPIEASVNGIFDEKSDVWSYGVTCWEATSYGMRPYQGVSINLLFMKIQNGYRLEKPKDCPDDFYNIIDRCWKLNKNDRPKFSKVVKDIETVLVNVYRIEPSEFRNAN
jgi:serine/threonine protein kinase